MVTNTDERMTDNGESSTSSSESDDQPAKRGRFVWQIKGSYQVKDEVRRKICIDEVENDVIHSNAILRWQNQQMAKAVFDNTVNSVIESMGLPIPEIENLMGNYSRNGNLEDEAVQMAIRSHGLQKACCCQNPHVNPLPNIPFHHRPLYSSLGPSSSRVTKEELEHNFLSEAIAVAIQKKGLGAYTSFNSNR